nr:energy transducer TonB [Carboxylicivirga marina]
MLSGVDRHELKRKTPCLFQGSPLVPYLYLVNNLSYPKRAINEDVEGEVVLALKVNSSGEVYSFYLVKKLHPLIDKAVEEVAKSMPYSWRFFPATNYGSAVSGEYHIIIEFDLEVL